MMRNPVDILNDMRQMHGAFKNDVEGRSYRMPIQQFAPGEAEELHRAQTMGVPTLYGKIMQRRHGGIQGRGVAGALGKSGMPSYSGQIQNENDALLQQYGQSPAIMALLGLR